MKKKQKVSSTPIAPVGNQDDPEYDIYLSRLQDRFTGNVSLIAGARPLFTTTAEDLFEVYLDHLPEAQRQYHTCSACRHFFRKYAGLVTITPEGVTEPAFWHLDDTPPLYQGSVSDIISRVKRARVTGVFLSSDLTWGQQRTGVWRHFSLLPRSIYKATTMTAGQKMAEKREDYKNVVLTLSEYPVATVQQAMRLLHSDTLYRQEKVLGPAQWLLGLHVARRATIVSKALNVTWLAVATAPAGFCHPKASMLGTLLEDIKSGKNVTQITRSFKEKMHPLQYQRPTAAPSSGKIAQAEKVVEQLKAEGSLRRRYARLEDLEPLWTPAPPRPAAPKAGGVFGHLKPREAETPELVIPSQTMTWAKFSSTVLPHAEEIEYHVKQTKDSYATILTAADPDAPPILQWDHDDHRNPVSWYFWHGGSTAEHYNLRRGAWCPVQMVTLKPSSWHGTYEHQGKGVIFVLKDAKDTRGNGGSALFPEMLKPEFHAIRSVIEAFSKTSTIEEVEDPAAGLMLQDGRQSSWDATFRVGIDGQWTTYTLDRWD